MRLAPGAVVVGVLLACCPLLAADGSLDAGQYGHTAWRARDGFLRGASIQAIAQTTDGILWLGTDSGLFRFDGLRYVPWQPPPGRQLPSTDISSLLGTRDGALWIGTHQGLVRWKDGDLTSYKELAGRIGRMLEDREGVLWATRSAVVRWTLCAVRDERASCYGDDGGPGDATIGLYEDTHGTLWARALKGVWRWKPEPRALIRVPDETGIGLTGLAEDDSGALLISGPAEIRRLAHGAFERAHRLPVSSTIAPSYLLRDPDGGLWVGSREGVIHLHGDRMDTLTASEGLSGNSVAAMMTDREGNIWVATTGGLDRFRKLPVATVSRTQGLPGTPNSIFASRDGTVWFASGSGLYRWRPGDATVARISGENLITAFQDDRGRMWASTIAELGYLDEGRFVPVAGVPGGTVFEMAQDARGALWFKYLENGVMRLSRDGGILHIPRSALKNNVVTSLRVDPRQGGVWLGFVGGGVAYVADDRVKASYAEAEGLPAAGVNDITPEPDGTVWIATRAGLSRLKDGRAATLTPRNGLPCTNVHSAVEDDARSLWLMMSCGIVRIQRAQLDLWAADVGKQQDSARRVEALVLDSADGAAMWAQAGGTRAIAAKSTDGRLWFRSIDGVTVVDPRRVPREAAPVPVRIEQIAADGLLNDVLFQSRATYTLPPRVHDLRIEYTALSLSAPDRIQFRCKLEGFDRDWQDVGNRRQAFYTNLPPRRYRFRVMAASNAGVWNDTGAALDFSIAPAYYQTTWFPALVIGLTAALIWATHRVRLRIVETHEREITALNERLMKTQEQERMRIAGELHDGIMQQMLSVTMMLGSAKRRVATNPSEATATIEKVQEKLVQAGTDIRQLSHGLHPPILQEAGLAEAVRSYCVEFGGARGISIACEADERVRDLSRGAALALFRVVQEALGNAAKHAQAKQIAVRLTRTNGDVSLTVLDDGVGFEVDAAGAGGLGLVMMRERASQLGGTFHITSAPGHGTTILVVIPFR